MRVVLLGAAGSMASVVLRDLLEFAPDDRGHRRRPPAGRDSRPARPKRHGRRARRGRDRAPSCRPRCLLELRHVLLQRPGDARGAGRPRALHRPRRSVPRHAQAVRARRGVPARGGSRAARHGLDARHHQRDGGGLDAADSTPSTSIHVRVGSVDRAAERRAPGPLRPRHGARRVCARADGLPRRTRRGRAADERRRGDRLSRAPIGTADAFYTLHSEVAMFPRSFPGPAGGELQGGVRAGLHRARCASWSTSASRRARSVDGGYSPREMLLALAARQTAADGRLARRLRRLRVDVSGTEGREAAADARGEMIVLPHPRLEDRGGSARHRRAACRSPAQMLADGTISQPGVLCPEIVGAARALLRGALAARHGAVLL